MGFSDTNIFLIRVVGVESFRIVVFFRVFFPPISFCPTTPVYFRKKYCENKKSSSGLFSALAPKHSFSSPLFPSPVSVLHIHQFNFYFSLNSSTIELAAVFVHSSIKYPPLLCHQGGYDLFAFTCNMWYLAI